MKFFAVALLCALMPPAFAASPAASYSAVSTIYKARSAGPFWGCPAFSEEERAEVAERAAERALVSCLENGNYNCVKVRATIVECGGCWPTNHCSAHADVRAVN